MPYYQFMCQRCLEKEEVFYKMSDVPPFINCQKCNGVSYRLYGCYVNVHSPTHEARKGRGMG